MTGEYPADRRRTAAPDGELLARKGRATARGFGTAATLDAVAAEVARPVRPRTAIELGRPSGFAPDPGRGRTAVRVLIADGDALSRKLYRDVLEANGYEVVVAANGVEALEVARHRQPDIAVVNLRLAELSGLEVARRINDRGDDSRPGAIAVVAVAEMARSGDEAAARSGGCAAYLAKPIPVRTFVETIVELTPPPSPSMSPPA